MLDFLSLLIVVLENATRLSVQFRKGNNIIWAPSALTIRLMIFRNIDYLTYDFSDLVEPI